MAINLPFNFNPDSVAIKTSSYTIPADTYAYVTPNCYHTNFTIDSVVVQSAHIIEYDRISDTVGSSITISYPVEVEINYTVRVAGSLDIQYSGSTSLFESIATLGVYRRILSAGDVIKTVGDSNNTYAVRVRRINQNNGAGYWVPSGTQLAGDNYTVMEYSLA